MHRVLPIALTALIYLGTNCALAQQTAHHVAWSYDPVNNVVNATPASYTGTVTPETSSSNAKTSATTYTGTVDVALTANLISSVPKGAILRCSSNVGLEYTAESSLSTTSSAFATSSFGILNSTESADAKVSGSTATCTFSIPYSWTVPASTSTTTVKIGGITGSVGITEYVLDSVTGTKTLRVVRSTSVELTGPSKMPADGTTTALTASTVL